MRRSLIYGLVAIAAIPLMGVSQCGEPNGTPTAKNQQAEKAQQAANSIQFTDNAEIDNIKRRLELTSKPGLLGFIVLLDGVGRPIAYESVKGKVTSGMKRLTKPWERHKWDCGANSCDHETASPSDEGTYGASDPYIYYWTTNDEYRQWNGRYLYSDRPFRLAEPPLVVSSVPADAPKTAPTPPKP